MCHAIIMQAPGGATLLLLLRVRAARLASSSVHAGDIYMATWAGHLWRRRNRLFTVTAGAAGSRQRQAP